MGPKALFFGLCVPQMAGAYGENTRLPISEVLSIEWLHSFKSCLIKALNGFKPAIRRRYMLLHHLVEACVYVPL